MNNIFIKLEELGWDKIGSMERFLEDEELYLICLESFQGDESFYALEKCIKEKKYDEAFEHAHSLKGVAGNLGLTVIFEVLSSIVERLRAKHYDDLNELYNTVKNSREELKNIFLIK